MPIRYPRRAGLLLRTDQTTCYHVGDDGDIRAGLGKRYSVLTTGPYALTSDIEVASYAGNQISFVAPNQVNDAGGGLAHILTGDTVVIKGSPLNSATFTVAGGGLAAGFTTVEAIANEGAGAYVSLYKRTTHSNEIVLDHNTGRWWSRYTSTGEKVGELSNGTLIWADITKVYTIYSAANTISVIMPGNILQITGGAALTQFHVGDLVRCVGFANAVNNLPGYYVVSATPNGANLDIVLDPSKQTLIAEGAVGDSIGLVTRSVYNYAAGARLGSLSGYTDWKVADDIALNSIREMEAPSGVPDAVAFPGWPALQVWTSDTRPDATTQGIYLHFLPGGNATSVKTTAYLAALIRG